MTARPKKVLHVLNGAGGGAALSTLGLIESLAEQGIGSAAVCHEIGSADERERLRDAVHGEVLFTRLYWMNRKIRLPLWRRPLAELKQIAVTGWSQASAARVAQCAQRWQADLIHTNTILTPEGGLAARQLALPHVWHVRELLGPGNPFRLRGEGPALGRYWAQHCDRLVANSEITAAQIRDWLPAGLLEVVPNGIDISRFHPRWPAAEGPLVVAMVGNLTSRWKKHALFVEAAALVDRSLPIRWRIYGHDPSAGGTIAGDAYMDELHAKIARAGLVDRFDWPGFHADPSEIMAQLDLLVHPADHESFGRVVVEAMAAGLPVVGVRGGGVAEIIDHQRTGLVVDPDSPAELAAAIEQLARQRDRRLQMGRAGRARAEDKYSLTACAGGILRVYEQALASHAPQRPASRAAAVAH